MRFQRRAVIKGFDEKVYLQANSDVEKAIKDGHFLNGSDHLKQFGLEEIKRGGRPFHSDFVPFNEQEYLETFEDVSAAVANGDFQSGFDHFCQFGFEEIISGNRVWRRLDEETSQKVENKAKEYQTFVGDQEQIDLIKGHFDEGYYRGHNPELVEAGVNNFLLHYFYEGSKEGRKPNKWFDPKFYSERYPDVAESKLEPLAHFLRIGYKEKRAAAEFRNEVDTDKQKAKEAFDETYYLANNPDIDKKQLDPFHHYYNYGWKEGRRPNEWFDPNYYMLEYPDVVEIGMEPLAHFIKIGQHEGRHPAEAPKETLKVVEEAREAFDEAYYFEKYPDIKEAGVDGFEHYAYHGWKENRKPNEWFEPLYYYRIYKDVELSGYEPLSHYLLYGKQENRKTENYTKVGNRESYDYLNPKNPNEDFVAYVEHKPLDSKLKAIAFYLPQFHPFPENDEWWGKGFTEWTNVTKAQPNFIGHYQPRYPIHNGFYDLRVPEVMIEQARLAKNYGIYGFNFYFYWFDGKILMHRPFEILLEHKEIDINYCITWANENWSRRWDGAENDILIGQRHCEEDSIKFIENLYKYFEDERYIRIDNKPVLIIYRVDIIPDMKATGELWRQKIKEAGFDGLYLICSQTFGIQSPEKYGFDAAMEFPPHTARSHVYNYKVDLVNREYEGNIYSYEQVVDNACRSKEPDFKLFRTSMLAWDNTARKQNNSHTYINFSIDKYKEWMSKMAQDVMENDKYADDEKLIFINAWNEWAEGTHLEPDRKFGYAYLQSTHDVLKTHAAPGAKKIVFVSHDAFFSGAQMLSLNIIRVLHDMFKLDVHMIIKAGGALEENFKAYATVYNLEKDYASPEKTKALISRLYESGARHAICNTVVSGDVLGLLSDEGFSTIALIHELPKLIQRYGMEGNAALIAEKADRVIFPSNFVKDRFALITEVEASKAVVSPQGQYLANRYQDDTAQARKELRELLGLDAKSKVLLGTGYADHRKGVDIFIDIALGVAKSRQDTYFVWIGDLDPDMERFIDENYDLDGSNVIFVPTQPDIAVYYSGADIYLMTSREDPFPSVVMEAMNARVPVIGFKDAGGFQDIVTEETGILVPYEDISAMKEAVEALLEDEARRRKYGEVSSKLIREHFVFKDYIYKLLDLVGMPYKKVSVVVPNYNYEKYIEARLQSVEVQKYPIYELLYLEDCSPDNSLDVAKEFMARTTLNMKIFENETNSGSVFKQWAKGIGLAKGDYVWIAEADDLADSEFLPEVMKGFNDDEVVLSYAQSQQIDQDDNLLNENYLTYTNDVHETKWHQDYINDGMSELSEVLVVKNTIPNVSGVVFKKHDISPILDRLLTFKVGGDWYFYIWLLKKGKIAFTARALNAHRRHVNSVTVSPENNRKHYSEIVEMQDYVKASTDISEAQWDKVMQYRAFVKNYLGVE